MAKEKPRDPLQDLDARLAKARGGRKGGKDGAGDSGPPMGNPLGLALRVGVELVSALAVGLGVGWLLDRWLETGPWLMLVFILLGGAAGILNVYRMARGFGYAAGYRSTDPDDGKREK